MGSPTIVGKMFEGKVTGHLMYINDKSVNTKTDSKLVRYTFFDKLL